MEKHNTPSPLYSITERQLTPYQRLNQLAEQVTAEVVDQLHKGKVLWQKPWTSLGLPRNYASGRPYEGFNAFYLNYITEKQGYKTPCFLTFRQAREMGGRVKKGQKGTPILYWKVYDCKKAETADECDTLESGKQGKRLVPFLWTVFNIDQVAGVDFRLPTTPERTELQVLKACQRVVEHFPSPAPQILHGGSEACYAPARDIVQVPALRRFISPESYHATLFHELIHATGHPSRLDRFTEEEKASRFAGEAYSKEELAAEMGASFLCEFTGIKEQVFENSVAYLQGWISRLQNDKTMILYAAAKAFKAASYILNLKAEEQQAAPPTERAAA